MCVVHASILAWSVDCPPREALLPPSDPAYADAMQLADELRVHGFTISCIFPSKLGSFFMVEEGGKLHSTIEGDAVFRTDAGDIEVVFLPKPQTWDHFKISERHMGPGNGYMY